MLQLFAIPQISHIPNIIWQQDGAPPHWENIVRRYLDTQLPQRWIGRDGPLVISPRSPDLTALDFFLVGICQEQSLLLENDRHYTAQDTDHRSH